MTKTYRRGAWVYHPDATPPKEGSSITIPVSGVTGVDVPFAVGILGREVTVTASAGACTDTKAVTDIWYMGWATEYCETEPLPSACGTYKWICALPYAGGDPDVQVVMQGRRVKIWNPRDEHYYRGRVAWPGPWFPLAPHYPTTDPRWNHYFGDAGSPPSAVALEGRFQVMHNAAEQDTYRGPITRAIIDMDNHLADEEGHTLADVVLPAGPPGTRGGEVQWQLEN